MMWVGWGWVRPVFYPFREFVRREEGGGMNRMNLFHSKKAKTAIIRRYCKLLRGWDVYVGYFKAIKKMRMFPNMGSVNPK